jgi:hypothetical protein
MEGDFRCRLTSERLTMGLFVLSHAYLHGGLSRGVSSSFWSCLLGWAELARMTAIDSNTTGDLIASLASGLIVHGGRGSTMHVCYVNVILGQGYACEMCTRPASIDC